MGMARKNSTLILKNLNEETDLETLFNTFKPFGKMSGLRIRSSKKDKAIILGFIEYKSITEAENAFEKIKKEALPLKINGSEIEIDYAIPQNSTRTFRNRYSAIVKGIEASEVDTGLAQALGCLRLDARKDKIFAHYRNQDDLTKALESVEKTVNGKKITIEKLN